MTAPPSEYAGPAPRGPGRRHNASVTSTASSRPRTAAGTPRPRWALLALPHVRAVSELDGFADAYTHVTGGLVARGNLVPDAHLAAILFQHGIRTLYSSDRDFRKFSSLEVRDPFA